MTYLKWAAFVALLPLIVAGMVGVLGFACGVVYGLGLRRAKGRVGFALGMLGKFTPAERQELITKLAPLWGVETSKRQVAAPDAANPWEPVH